MAIKHIFTHTCLLIVCGIVLHAFLLDHHPTSVSIMVDAYQTYEVVRYCRKHNPSSNSSPHEEMGKNVKRFERKYGLIVPELDNDDDNDDDDQNANVNANSQVTSVTAESRALAAKSIVVDGEGGDSAIRIVLAETEKTRAHQRNWQYCSVFVQAQKPHGLILTIRKLNLRSGIDWLRLVINNGTFVREFSHVKIDDERDSVAYVANHGVLIELETGYSTTNTPDENQLELTLTAFRDADLCAIDDEFDCGSFRCISNYYLCDGVNNCGDGRDELGCPLENLTNYIIISVTLVLVALCIFLCLCYRCCCTNGQQQRRPTRKQYQYVKIRTNSLVPLNGGGGGGGGGGNERKPRGASIHSEADMHLLAPPPLPGVTTTTFNRMMMPRHNSLVTPMDNLRRFRLSHVADSMPVLIPSAPPAAAAANDGYGATGNTYMHLPPYPTYATIQLGSNGYGLIPAHHIIGPGSIGRRMSRNRRQQFAQQQQQQPRPPTDGGDGGEQHQQTTTSENHEEHHHTFPLRPTHQPYPMLHPALFQPPTSTSLPPPPPPQQPPPPPYTPREDTTTSPSTTVTTTNTTSQQQPSAPAPAAVNPNEDDKNNPKC